jgi:membrane fusion protein (multidrug efflux system)
VSSKILLEGLRVVREHDKVEYEVEDPNKAMAELALYAE